MNYKNWLFGIIAIIVFAIIIGFSVSGSNDTIKVGLVAPLSGDTAIWGNNVLVGTQIAIDEFNAKGGLDGKKIELIVEDGKCSAEGGSKAYNTIVNGYDVIAMLGPVCSAEASAGLPIGVTKNIPTVIATASAPELTALGDNIFRVYPSDALQGVFAADYVYNKLGKKKTAIIYVSNAWGQGVADKFKTAYEKLGGSIVYYDKILQDEIEVKDIIANAKGKGAEALYLPIYPTAIMAVFKTVKELNWDISILGGDATLSEEVIKNNLSENTLFTQPKFSISEELKNKVKEKEGEDFMINVGASYGYDATRVLLIALENADSLSSEDIITELAKTKMVGVSNPLIEFDAEGDLKTGEFEVQIIKNNEAVPVK